MLLGEGAGRSETLLIFCSIAPRHVWVQIPPYKNWSRAINAPLKTPCSRGGFCYPSVILFGKQRVQASGTFPACCEIQLHVQPSPVGRKENKVYFLTSFSKLGVGELCAWPETVVIIQG